MENNPDTLRFVDFLMSLAPEGETALLVRQKPQRKDGELQFHADGAIKCTWPAYLPNVGHVHLIAPSAWYCRALSLSCGFWRTMSGVSPSGASETKKSKNCITLAFSIAVHNSYFGLQGQAICPDRRRAHGAM